VWDDRGGWSAAPLRSPQRSAGTKYRHWTPAHFGMRVLHDAEGLVAEGIGAVLHLAGGVAFGVDLRSV
jgi:hypothetical protein